MDFFHLEVVETHVFIVQLTNLAKTFIHCDITPLKIKSNRLKCDFRLILACNLRSSVILSLIAVCTYVAPTWRSRRKAGVNW